ncbi:MAG: hypothetical protein ACFFD1_03485 [Candidatus Thorarchaeota archaeon]
MVDIIFNGIDLLSIIKTSRHWLFLTCIWVFYYIPDKEIKKLIDYLLYALVIISVIMLIEFFLDIQILGKEIKTEYLTPGFLIERGSLPTILLMFFLFLLFSKYYKFKRGTKYFYIAIFSAVLVTSIIRSWLFAGVIGTFLIFYLQEKFRFKYLFKAIIITGVLMLVIFSSTITRERFTQGIEDVQSFNLTSSVHGNFSYRMLMAAERISYVLQSFQYEVFGIGNVTEYNFPNTFIVGLRDRSGRITQLDTGDIAWSLLFLRLGVFGTLIYLIFYTKILTTFYRLKLNNPIAVTTFTYLIINLAIISFASSDITSGWFWLFPLLMYYFITNKPNYENNGNNVSL